MLEAFTATYGKSDATLLADFVTSLETLGMITAELAAQVTAPTPQA